MSNPNKTYLADGVYAEHQPDVGMIKLTTENGIETTNTIYLEGETYAALLKFVERLEARAK